MPPKPLSPKPLSPKPLSQGLTIGELSARTGLAVSAIRFYEERGLVQPGRNAGGQRRFARSDIRRLSFVMIAQSMGFGLSDIAGYMVDLPAHRAPSKADWTRISDDFRKKIDARIAHLQNLRDRLDGCIGCGCLSLQRCQLYNRDDRAGAGGGTGPRYVLD